MQFACGRADWLEVDDFGCSKVHQVSGGSSFHPCHNAVAMHSLQLLLPWKREIRHCHCQVLAHGWPLVAARLYMFQDQKSPQQLQSSQHDI